MALIRAAVPALAGVILIAIGAGAITSSDLRPHELIYALGAAVQPTGIGIGLLVLAVAIWRGLRLGLLLGLVGAAGFVVLAAWFILSALPRIGEGPFNFVAPAIFVAGVLAVLSAGYAALLLRSRQAFAAGWQPLDRRIALALALIVLAMPTLTFGINAVAIRAEDDQAGSEAIALALVAGTTLEVSMVDAKVDAASSPSVVQHLTVDVTIRSATAYQLDAPPTLCLTDFVTYRDTGKPGALCWGADDPGFALEGPFASMTIVPQGATIRLDLDRGNAICPYTVGTWSAAVALVPEGPASTRSWIQTSFTVEADAAGSAPPPSGSAQEPTACTGISK